MRPEIVGLDAQVVVAQNAFVQISAAGERIEECSRRSGARWRQLLLQQSLRTLQLIGKIDAVHRSFLHVELDFAAERAQDGLIRISRTGEDGIGVAVTGDARRIERRFHQLADIDALRVLVQRDARLRTRGIQHDISVIRSTEHMRLRGPEVYSAAPCCERQGHSSEADPVEGCLSRVQCALDIELAQSLDRKRSLILRAAGR